MSKNSPVKTAVAIATDTAPPVAPPADTRMPLPPIRSEVDKTCKCRALSFNSAVHVLQEERAKFLAELPTYAPTVAADIQAEADAAHAAIDRLNQKTQAAAQMKGELQEALRGLGHTRQRIAAENVTLADAEKQLADPKCLALDPAALLRLEKQKQLVPVVIAKLQDEADALVVTIKDLLARSKFDGEKLLAHMAEEASYGPERRNPRDIHLHGLVIGGFMALPK